MEYIGKKTKRQENIEIKKSFYYDNNKEKYINDINIINNDEINNEIFAQFNNIKFIHSKLLNFENLKILLHPYNNINEKKILFSNIDIVNILKKFESYIMLMKSFYIQLEKSEYRKIKENNEMNNKNKIILLKFEKTDNNKYNEISLEEDINILNNKINIIERKKTFNKKIEIPNDDINIRLIKFNIINYKLFFKYDFITQDEFYNNELKFDSRKYIDNYFNNNSSNNNTIIIKPNSKLRNISLPQYENDFNNTLIKFILFNAGLNMEYYPLIKKEIYQAFIEDKKYINFLNDNKIEYNTDIILENNSYISPVLTKPFLTKFDLGINFFYYNNNFIEEKYKKNAKEKINFILINNKDYNNNDIYTYEALIDLSYNENDFTNLRNKIIKTIVKYIKE